MSGSATRFPKSPSFALDPERANLVARLKGNRTKRPILLMAHTDVVGVQRDKWPVDPFGAVVKDGYIWGRGARDDKDKLAANLMVMLLAKRMGLSLDRDLIFFAESGEEADPAGVGINFMVTQHFDEIDAEFALTEGGGATLDGGRVTTVNIQTTEKVPRRFLGGAGYLGTWLGAAARQSAHAFVRGGREGRDLADADAAQ
jgi:acetylornithine deacetylase/succinyl-diaminopimelate desuccinylase-like protein